MRVYLLWLFLLLSSFRLSAQSSTASRIVWLKNPQENIKSMLRNFETVREIYAPMGLWEVSLKKETQKEASIIVDRYWEELESVRYSGPNRNVQKRVIPNDVFYNNQPYLSHIGLEYVWNYQKNGIDVNGDTLVVAYIDDGADTSHPDLIANLYINHKEIPWNGIDDDENGYIDDYRGWNSGQRSPLVFSEVSILDGHGTNVAGVIGARGNNGDGVSGVNWNIKILPINTYPNNLLNVESAVIRAMVYAFKQKQLYLQTNKSKGINIVALNMSLGMDNAFPADAEYWCTLFDSLGSVGIWSYNATTNRNVDVSINGDIPTLCSSIFLISVNASNINDEHYSSGYSDSFIDLAAPGVNIYTTMPVSFGATKPYTTETGTSFASPMVAGISALMESMACPYYLALKDTQPLAAALLWRSWMKESVKRSASLGEKTAWGGRIDATQLFKAMTDWCEQNDSNFSGSNAISLDRSFVIFPNPSSGSLNFHAEVSGKLTFYDLLGRMIKEFNIEKGSGILNSDGLNGTYLGLFEGSNGEHIKKIHIFSNQ